MILSQHPTFRSFILRGYRFRYQYYYPAPLPLPSDARPYNISGSKPPSKDHPIWMSITDLDREGMNILELTSGDMGGGDHRKSASKAHEEFEAYLLRTKNTICGRHPIGVLMGALGTLEDEHGERYRATL
ncbi:hypothetical protein FRC02_001628, partial [Tulasnella sp. 418]